MLENNYGYIVQISSILAHCGLASLSDYAASKAAVSAFSESLRAELKVARKSGILVTCVCPFHINTAMFDGATTNLSSMFPPLDVHYVAERTLRAMEERQFMVLLPRSMYMLPLIKK